MKLPQTAMLALCLALPICTLKVYGQTTTTQIRSQNIAVVSFNALVLRTNEAQRDLGTLEAKFAPRQSQLQVLDGEIEASRKELADNGGKLSDQERASRTQALNAKEKQLERSAEDFRNDSQAEGQAAFQKVAQEVLAFMQDYARQHDYMLVIDRGSDSAPVVWYAADYADITNQLVKAYNAKSGVPAPNALTTPSHPKAGQGAPENSPSPSSPRP
jgi:Skp family chaperone for outer membrane proteins